jgi:hypothetical protein
MRAIAFLSVLVAVTAAEAECHACHNGVAYDLDRDVRAVDRAERLLVRGDADQAMRVAHGAMSRMRRFAPRTSGERVERAQRVIAVAVVRLSGRVDLQRHRAVEYTTEPQRVRNLEWARDLLARLEARNDDPRLTAEYAEALASIEASRADALRRLRELESRDLLPDSNAYRVLAELERAEGNRTVSDALVRTCETRARRSGVATCHHAPRARR